MFDEEDRFNCEAMEQALGGLLERQNQVLLVLNTPANNPTGYSMTPEEMDRVVEAIRRFGALYPDKKITFCLDVSYIDFDDTFENTRRIFDCIRDMPENSMTLVVFSMSKSYTMCGMRCGALGMPGRDEGSGGALQGRHVLLFPVRVVQRGAHGPADSGGHQFKPGGEAPGGYRAGEIPGSDQPQGGDLLRGGKACGLKMLPLQAWLFHRNPLQKSGQSGGNSLRGQRVRGTPGPGAALFALRRDHGEMPESAGNHQARH